MGVNKNRDALGRVLEEQKKSSKGTPVAQDLLSAVPVRLIAIFGYNADSALRYVQLHDKASAISPGDVPDHVIPVPANSATFSLAVELDFALGLQVGISTTAGTFTSAGTMLSYTAKLATVAAAS